MPLDSQVSSDRSNEGLSTNSGPSTSAPPDTSPQPSGLNGEQAPEAAASDEAVVVVAPIWLQRLSLFVLVLFCVYLGVLVMVLPWWTRIWDHNELINSRPALAAVLHIGAVKGLISGLGMLDIWIGISEAIHYRDHRP
jgi:hypothetical protein